MSNEPHTISLDQVLELVRGLGIEPDRQTLKSLHIEGCKVEVVRYRLNEDGRQYLVGPNELATETITIRMGASA